MKYSFDVKISEHIWEDSLGQLICVDAIIAREGDQDYYEDDIFNNGSYKIVKITRPWNEVLKSAPTFEAKPIIIQHPDKSVDIKLENIKEYKVGHMQNVRPSEFEGIKVLIADLVFDDIEAIKKVKSGELRELSCGYFYEINKEKMEQYDIKGEHLALVEEGRAGIAKILDSKQHVFDLSKYITLKTKEQREDYMSKIQSEDLEKVNQFYVQNKESLYTPEEIDITIKVIERELNKRNRVNMGLNEEEKKAQDNFLTEETSMFRIKKGDIIHIEGNYKDADFKVHSITKDKKEDKVILYNKDGNIIHIGSWNDNIKLHKEDKIQDDLYTTDLYIRDKDIDLELDTEDLAWVSEKPENLKQGDIISMINSIRLYEIKSINKKGDLYLISTISNETGKTRLFEFIEDDEVDVLIYSKTGKKVSYSQKSNDANNIRQLKDLIVGDIVVLQDKREFPITEINKDKYHLYTIKSNQTPLFVDAEKETTVTIK
jgi:hypothetical protein